MNFLSFCQSLLLNKFLEWIREDEPFGDITSEALIPSNISSEAIVLAKSEGIASCTQLLASVLQSLGVRVKVLVKDGEKFSYGDKIMLLKGNTQTILSVERTLLNLLIYLFGVATMTRRLVEAIKKVNPKVRVAATRKYPPGMGCLVKRAVRDGGGDTHRFSLSDAYLIKDNHLRIVGSVAEAVRRALRLKSFIQKVEIEVTDPLQAVEAAEAGADIIMFDNMKPNEIQEAINLLKERKLRDRVLLEISGGITPENITEYAKLDIDVISSSYITMRPERVDLSLEVLK